MPVSTRQGWGNIQQTIGATTLGGGQPWVVAPNIGLGVQIPVSSLSTRLSYIHFRTALRAGATTDVDWTIYRLLALRGQIPSNVASLQQLVVNDPGTSNNILDPQQKQGAGFDILDDWLYSPGWYVPAGTPNLIGTPTVATAFIGGRSSQLNQLMIEVHHEFGNGGPFVDPNDTLSVLFIPMIGNSPGNGGLPPQTFEIALALTAWGRDEADTEQSLSLRSLPRYDVRL